jgi:predicted kinase
MSSRPALVMFSGLPGTGKSTLSYQLAETLHWTLLTKDAIDRSLEQSDIITARGGYNLLFDLARLNLERGTSVILDAVFTTQSLRDLAADVAEATSARLRIVYCFNSDQAQWQRRITDRPEVVSGWTPADWAEVEQVQARYEALQEDHLALDSHDPLAENLDRLLKFSR